MAHRIRAWLREDPTRRQADLARAAGVSAAHISNLLEGTRGAGAKALRGIALALGTTWPDLEADAAEWARARDSTRPPTTTGLTEEEFADLLELAGRCTASQLGELLVTVGKLIREAAGPPVSSGKDRG